MHSKNIFHYLNKRLNQKLKLCIDSLKLFVDVLIALKQKNEINLHSL